MPPTLDTLLTRENLLEWGADEIVACDPRHPRRRRGTILGITTKRLWVEWFDSGRKTWVDAKNVRNWEGCTEPIPRRGFVVRALESAVSAAEASDLTHERAAG
jgi:hypothetical protein